MKTKNILVVTEEENTLFYCLSLTPNEAMRYVKIFKFNPIEAYEIKDSEIQYYIIGTRIFCDTETKEGFLRKLIEKIL